MVSPTPGSVPIPAVPVPAPPERDNGRKRNRVMQSSLELVFSYSRHQQLRYGGSAPSFVESSSSRSYSTPPDQLPNRGYDPADELAERDVSGRWAELEAASRRGRTVGEDRAENDVLENHAEVDEEEEDVDEPAEEDGEEGDANDDDTGVPPDQHRRTSDEPSFFHSDPLPPPKATSIPSTTSQNDTLQPHTASSSSVSPSASTAASNRGLISINMFSPHIAPSALGTSYGTGSSGSQTPRIPSLSVPRVKKEVATSRRREDLGGSDDEDTNLLKDRPRDYGGVDVEQATVSARRAHSIRHPSGQSTDGQTLFNATAVLVGIGLLSLPLAFAYAGWVGGTLMLLGFGWLTCHTAKLLASLIYADPNMMGYTDIGVRAFGTKAGAGIHILFCLELFALGVALIVLFGDTLNVLYPTISSNAWKIIGFSVILPTALLPLRLLSLPSLLSSVSSLLLVLVLLIDGFVRPTAPGSLRHPMPTSWSPEWQEANWLGGIGLILAGFGGHAVMPSLARDMRRPENFDKIVNKAFAIATVISFIAGAAGYLMIGQGVSDEITRDLKQEKYHYPRILNTIALWMIVINPLTKFGLSSRPLNITLETILGISDLPPSGHLQSSVDDQSSADIQPRSGHRESIDPLDSELSKSDQSPESLTHIRSREGQDRSDAEIADVRRRSSSFSDERSNAPLRHRKMSHSQPHPRPHDHSHVQAHANRNTAAGLESGWSYVSFVSNASQAHNPGYEEPNPRRNAILRIISRTIVTALCVVTAVLLPGFGRVMAFLGSFSAFLICIILPHGMR
ncbi:hypothetical protein I316_02489 [Kwoniella heveanensis BCC8398]|uniref:Amino acid transporter transmembrane domain-containing protein n=1 Tax=Kwoniella heveanensis BCC8398 TaxID=1296120 RepID=A0A1B9GY69_9TREE|nr:hypothetical protein I316_02489 [Kwoniella heveanensis BCC8398]